jgi:polysaccharide pyruvyl transferase WcaK-like protein
MKKIAVVGLYSIANMGDLIICESTERLIRDIMPDAEIVRLDANHKEVDFYRGFRRLTYYAFLAANKIAEHIFSYGNGSGFRHFYESLMWKVKTGYYYKRDLAGVDAVVFAGGGFLKFRTQGLNYHVEHILRICDRQGIPVMMNAVGIEGYDAADARCRALRDAVSRPCVKTITTRDDIETLTRGYAPDGRIVTAQVGDPAFRAAEVYGLVRRADSRTAGINVIRGAVYREYGNRTGADALKDFYLGLLAELDARGVPWTLFSNGIREDYGFGVELLRETGPDCGGRLLDRPVNTKQFMEQVAGFGAVFGARLHACITAYALDIPVCGLIWNEKATFFSDIVGKREYFFTEDELDPARVAAAIERCLKDGGSGTYVYDTSKRAEMADLTRRYLAEFLSASS